MINLSAAHIAEITGGELHGENVQVTAPPTLASNECAPGSLFLAIKGERVDGHDFASDAFEKGAALALTTRAVEGNYVIVNDVTEAIGKIALFVRNQLSEMKVIGITGSQGKTTTKELLYAILSESGRTVATLRSR